MCPQHLKTSLLILLVSLAFCRPKPVMGPMGVAENHKIAMKIRNEQNSIEELKEERAILVGVVESLDDKIDEKWEHVREMKSYAKILEEYRNNFNNGPQSRPGR